uniref:Carboxypeptidase n=1 Tax=Panagrolaimus sp. ES5 TaxID=591445 RepID=A0AC34F8S9_9BILA
MKALTLLIFLFPFFGICKAAGDADKIIGDLPGTTFKVNFDQYSGYLNAGNGGKWKFFYWLVESQTGNSSNDPLIVWFNGGPGCSSLGGLFEELGPFYVNSDRKTLYENIYSWNKYANVLAIESPIGVGFSYDVDNVTAYTVGDDLTAQQNHDALADFFANVQPRYKNRQWFIAGESYAGIYIPTVTQKLFQSIVNGTFPNPNFTGIAIGNGYMNIKALTNALVLWTSYHGLIGLPQWRDLKQTCCAPGSDVDNCDFAKNFNYVYMNDTKNNACANKYANVLAIESPIGVGFSYDVDNVTAYTVGDDLTAQQNHDALADFFSNVQPRYKDRQWFIAGESYAGIYIPTVTQKLFQSIVNGTFPNPNFTGIAIGNGYMNIKALTNALVLWTSYHGLIGLPQWRDLKQTCCAPGSDVDNCDFTKNFNYVYMNDTKNNACANKDKIYYDSSDNQFGYPCDNGDRARAYFSQPEVLRAFHIDDAWINAKLNWTGCNIPLNENYPVTYNDTTDVFKYIIQVATNRQQFVKNFRILIYNGDVDTVCNFLGDSWHIDNIASQTGLNVI